MQLSLVLTLTLGLSLPGPPGVGGTPEALTPGRLVVPGTGDPAVPLVLMLPDATGEEGRSEPYADALVDMGMASLALGLEDGGAGNGSAPLVLGPDKVVAAFAMALAQLAPLDRQHIAVIGFGSGARTALAAGHMPMVALDPGCRGLTMPSAGDVLLVHGLAAPDAAACAAFDGLPGLTRLGLEGVGHGWDLPLVAAPGGALLPDPSGAGRRRAQPDPIATAAVAEEVAAWLAARLGRTAP